jgi:uncharacterized protein YqeY
MGIASKVDQDLVAATKARDELRLSLLRMTKTAPKLKQVELSRTLLGPMSSRRTSRSSRLAELGKESK